MLIDFCLRLALGMTACLLLLSPLRTARPTPSRKALANPAFFRTQFLTVLGLACAAFLYALRTATWPLLAALAAAMLLACLASVAWSLERSPGGVAAIVLTAAVLSAGLVLRERAALLERGSLAGALAGAFSSSALMGAAVSAMLVGHSYLIAPTMSLTPLYRLLAALALALACRMAVDGFALAAWAEGHSLAGLEGDALLWLPVRWVVGLLAPLVLCWMAWQTARIRSTQSATGILYVAVVFCLLGELIGQLLRETGLTL
jgi:hypothetical protein